MSGKEAVLSPAKADAGASIQVVARFRPQNSLEVKEGGKICINVLDEKNCSVTTSEGDKPYTFAFDRVFEMGVAQSEVYNTVGRPVMDDVFKGYNGTIFVYGQTGAGKSFTMMGPNNSLLGYCDDPKLKGLIPRVIESIFQFVEAADANIEFSIKVSYIEIYLEKIRDLFDPSKTNLQLHEDKNSGRGIYVDDATEAYVGSASEIFELMQRGASNRVVASTRMNAESSRSHSIFIITIGQKDLVKLEQKSGKLFLVDLAGSEKVSKTGAEGQQLDEAKNINKSLSALGNVINALTDGKSTHVPYRDSKLTRLLQDSLGGNSRTTLVINCSCSSYNDQETLSTLRFGYRAKSIKNKPRVNKELSVAELKLLLAKAEAEISRQKIYAAGLDDELKAYKSGKAVAAAGGSAQAVDLELLPNVAALRDQLAQLEEKLRVESEDKTKAQESQEELADQLSEKKEELTKQIEIVQRLEAELQQYKDRMDEYEKEKEFLVNQLVDLQFSFEKEQFENNERVLTLESLTSANETLKKEISTLQGLVSGLKTQVLEGGSGGDDSNNAWRKEKAARDEEERSFQKSLADHINRLEGNISANNSGSSGVSSSAESEETHKKIQELQEQVAVLEKTRASLSEERDSLVQKLEEQQVAAAPINPSSVSSPSVSSVVKQEEPEVEITSRDPDVLMTEIERLKKEVNKKNEELERSQEENEWKLAKLEASYKNQVNFMGQKEEERKKQADGSKATSERVTDLTLQIERMEAVHHQKQEEFKRQSADFEVVKTALLKDLQNRCEKVIDLEMELDDIQDKYQTLMQSQSDKALKQRMGVLEKNLEQLTSSYQQMYNENASLRMEIQLAEKKLSIRNDRIQNLEHLLQDAQERMKRMTEESVMERARAAQEMEQMRNMMASGGMMMQQQQQQAGGQPLLGMPVRRPGGSLSTPGGAVNISRIVKPLRGGGGSAPVVGGRPISAFEAQQDYFSSMASSSAAPSPYDSPNPISPSSAVPIPSPMVAAPSSAGSLAPLHSLPSTPSTPGAVQQGGSAYNSPVEDPSRRSSIIDFFRRSKPQTPSTPSTPQISQQQYSAPNSANSSINGDSSPIPSSVPVVGRARGLSNYSPMAAIKTPQSAYPHPSSFMQSLQDSANNNNSPLVSSPAPSSASSSGSMDYYEKSGPMSPQSAELLAQAAAAKQDNVTIGGAAGRRSLGGIVPDAGQSSDYAVASAVPIRPLTRNLSK